MSGRHTSAAPARYWLRSGLLTLLERGCGLVFAFGTAALLLRHLSKPGFAAWGLFLIAGYFVEMGRAGLIQNGLVRHLAIYRDRKGHYAAISTASLLLNVVFSLVAALLLWSGATWLARTFNAPAIEQILPVYVWINFAMIPFTHFNFIQQANLEFRGVFWSTFCYRGMLFAWVLWCVLSERPVELYDLAMAMLAGAVLGVACSWLFARRHLLHARRVDGYWLKKLAGYGKYVLGTNLSTMFYKNIDKLSLGHLLGPAAFAVYDAAGKVTQMIETPSFSIAQVVFPKSAGYEGSDNREGVKRLYERSVAAILAIILPFVALVLLFAEPIIHLFAGAAYMESASVMRLTALFGLFMPFAVQFGTILDSTGKPAVNFLYTLFTAALNLALSWLFVLKYGLFGAAFATLTAYTVSFVLMQRYLFRHFGISALNAIACLPGVYRSLWLLLREKRRQEPATGARAHITPEKPVNLNP